MRQVWIPKIGGPEVLEVREAPDPVPGPGYVRIRVAAAGVNFADCMARMGLYPDAPKLPTVVGYEVSGTVDAVGPEVSAFSVGDRVLSVTRFGGYTDCAVVQATQVHRIPDALSFEKAAALPVNYLTAWLMLVRLGNLQASETVLIHGAGGGVGLAALQIARWRGATLLGTASAGKHERLLSLGLDHAIDYRTQDFEAEARRLTGGRGVHVVLDPIGGSSFKKSYALLAPMGRLFLFGNASMATGKKRNLITAGGTVLAMPRFHPLKLMDRNVGVFGVNLGHLWDEVALLRESLEAILARVAAGDLDPVVDRTFPLEETGAAHAWLQDRKNFGKVLLTTGAGEG